MLCFALHRFFHEHGYISLGRAAPLAAVEALGERIDDLMLGRLTLPRPMLWQLCPSASDLPQFAEHGGAQSKVWKGSTLRYRKVQDLEQDELYLEYMSLPIFRDITRKIVAERVSVYRSMFFNKPAGVSPEREGGVVINWHQDGNPVAGWGLDIDPKITIWTALDDCTIENGAVTPRASCRCL